MFCAGLLTGIATQTTSAPRFGCRIGEQRASPYSVRQSKLFVDSNSPIKKEPTVRVGSYIFKNAYEYSERISNSVCIKESVSYTRTFTVCAESEIIRPNYGILQRYRRCRQARQADVASFLPVRGRSAQHNSTAAWWGRPR